jgi:hypothetical protein
MTFTPIIIPNIDSNDSGWQNHTVFATVTREVDLSFAAQLVVRYSVRGLPCGLRFDPLNGRISGKGERPGTCAIFITAPSASGQQTITTVPLVVAAMIGAGAWRTVLPNA